MESLPTAIRLAWIAETKGVSAPTPPARQDQHTFIDVIAAAFRAHPEQRIAVVLEPDSLLNLVTDLDRPRCKNAEGIYKPTRRCEGP